MLDYVQNLRIDLELTQNGVIYKLCGEIPFKDVFQGLICFLLMKTLIKLF